MSKRLTEGDIKGMLQMHDDGISMANIARAYECSVYTVFRHISAVNGVKQMKSFTLEEKQSAVNDWLSGRYTARQVATSHGIGVSTLEKWTRLHKTGKLNNIQVSHAGPTRKVTDDSLAVAVELYNKGHGIRVIAEHIGVSPDAVKRNLVRIGVYQGVERVKSTKGRKGKFSDDTKRSILKDYTTGTMTIPKLAEKYGASAPTITKILESFGVHHESTGRKGLSKDGLRYDTDQVVTDYKTGEFTHKSLAEKYGVSTRTISRILDNAGVEALGGHKLASADDIAGKRKRIQELSDSREDVFSIAQEVGLPAASVSKVITTTEAAKERKESDKKTRIAELHSQGLILKDIAKEADMSVYLVKKILEELGLEQNSPSDKHRPCVVELCKQGMSVDSIASQVGLSVPTVRKILHEEGLTPSKGDNEVKKRVLELFNQGMKSPQIASECGISAPTVRKIIATSGQVKGLNERIVELYDGGMEIEQIAQEVGLNRPLVMIELSKAMKAGTLYRPFFPESDISVIKHLASKWTTPDKIALHLGCDENYIRRFLQLPDKKI